MDGYYRDFQTYVDTVHTLGIKKFDFVFIDGRYVSRVRVCVLSPSMRRDHSRPATNSLSARVSVCGGLCRARAACAKAVWRYLDNDSIMAIHDWKR
jgi:hypothetical protein